MRYHASSFDDFRCGHCGNHVTVMHMVSGVNNRNHCPYCLWSRHLDLFAAGDRLSACKGQMKPIGLTMKKSRNKYQIKSRGELMLIHQCTECGGLSINRIATDDDPDSVMDVFFHAQTLDSLFHRKCREQGIVVLADVEIVSEQLYGHGEKVPALSWV